MFLHSKENRLKLPLYRNTTVLSLSALALMTLGNSPLFAQGPPRRPQPPQGPWMNKSLSPDTRANMVIEKMTLDEKISLVHGAGFPGFGNPNSDPETAATLARANGGAGIVPGIPRLGIPDLNLADSAVGVTRGAMKSRYSTALPSTIALAASWNPSLAREFGALIGRELRDQGYNVSLGGGVNITREPRNGRNFEYQGEDPILAGKMGGAMMKGLQDQHVIGDIKHYAINDQETGRNIASVILDKRSMRETDLLAFEIAIKEADPGMVMSAYNKVNGDYCSENSYLLSDLLKKQWGFKGFVLSDWGGTHSTVKAALAGLDQEQPGGNFFGAPLKKAVESGDVPLSRLNDMVHRILRTEFACGIIDSPPVTKVVDVFGGLEVAQQVAEQTIVLLKNDKNTLPLNANKIKSIALIGGHSDVGVLSGGGSAQVDPPGGSVVPPPPGDRGGFFGGVVYYPSSPLKAIRAKTTSAKVTYLSGTDIAAAVELARKSEVAIVFGTQPSSEGADLASLSLPDNQDALIAAVVAANPRTIVVLETGGSVTMPWENKAGAILETWFPGIRGAEALAGILFGEVNPSAKSPITFAQTEADLPHPVIPGSELKPDMVSYPGAPANAPKMAVFPPFDIVYTEGLLVGYKWFDAKNIKPLFEFGLGLSYTSFSYSNLSASSEKVSFTLKNTGKREGVETVQLYVGLPTSANEPPRRLAGWEKVSLKAGESKVVTLPLDKFHLSIYNVLSESWELVSGEYQLFVGGSSRKTLLVGKVVLKQE